MPDLQCQLYHCSSVWWQIDHENNSGGPTDSKTRFSTDSNLLNQCPLWPPLSVPLIQQPIQQLLRTYNIKIKIISTMTCTKQVVPNGQRCLYIQYQHKKLPYGGDEYANLIHIQDKVIGRWKIFFQFDFICSKLKLIRMAKQLESRFADSKRIQGFSWFKGCRFTCRIQSWIDVWISLESVTLTLTIMFAALVCRTLNVCLNIWLFFNHIQARVSLPQASTVAVHNVTL
jgi:hypothetical protein